MTELSKNKILNKKVNITVETLIGIAIGIFTLMGMWFALQSDIQLAMEMPEAEVSRTEYDLKDQLIRETIMSTQDKVEENSDKLDKIDEKLYEIIKRK
tara:strand:- start:229 stop:522 length:294 start_codon:yes stop_codon:yes gene_type:complete